jgi:hypothetical protein
MHLKQMHADNVGAKLKVVTDYIEGFSSSKIINGKH